MKEKVREEIPMDQDNFEQDRKKKKSGNGKLIIILAVVLSVVGTFVSSAAIADEL